MLFKNEIFYQKQHREILLGKEEEIVPQSNKNSSENPKCSQSIAKKIQAIAPVPQIMKQKKRRSSGLIKCSAKKQAVFFR